MQYQQQSKTEYYMAVIYKFNKAKNQETIHILLGFIKTIIKFYPIHKDRKSEVFVQCILQKSKDQM